MAPPRPSSLEMQKRGCRVVVVAWQQARRKERTRLDSEGRGKEGREREIEEKTGRRKMKKKKKKVGGRWRTKEEKKE